MLWYLTQRYIPTQVDNLSKSTPTGNRCSLLLASKEVKKKDLAQIAMSYGYVYVAQIAMGADYNQCIKAIS